MDSSTTNVAVGHLLRELAPQVLGAIARRHDDFDAAEDAVQEALIAASMQWTASGVPANARGWLYQVAMRRLSDHRRSESARRDRELAVAQASEGDARASEPDDSAFAADEHEDDTLVLLFMCCHPSLTPPTAIALTLRAVGGLTTAEIASAFLVPEATMAQRVSRAKQNIRASNVPFGMPTNEDRVERLGAVLQVLYLMFSEGYVSSEGASLQRTDLSSEAIRLTRMLHALLPNAAEVAGLLALMLLTDARREARTGADGELISLDEQDRTRWDQALIVEGIALISATLPKGSVGPYQLQAAIAAVHDEAVRAEDTDWRQILALYGVLKRLWDSPMVSLGHAIATAMVKGPHAGLTLVDALDGDARISGHYRLDAVRGHLCEMAGDIGQAIEHYRAAAGRTASLPERDYLIGRGARLSAGDGHQPVRKSVGGSSP